MRARIDIIEAETDTKIRGKYLRALENEEWRLLPGPTFVRSFLKTYGDYLGLDGRLLVEEFKLRHERDEGELPQMTPQRRRPDSRRRVGGGQASAARARAVLVGALLLALLAGLFVLGRDSGGGETSTQAPAPAASAPRAAPAGVATLRIRPTAAVYVCLRAADGRRLVDGVLQPGGAGAEYRSRRLRLTLGNSRATLIVNGERAVPPRSSSPIGYEITVSGLRKLGRKSRPRCS